MKKTTLLCTAALLWLLLSPQPSAAQAGGVVVGQIANGSQDGGSVAGLEVVLRAFQGQQEIESLSATTDGQGAFRFERLETGNDRTYLARVAYQGVTYSTGMLTFEAGTNELIADIAVYETTTDDAAIVVERAHVFVSITEASLSVSELYVFANPTDRTYVGTQEEQGNLWVTQFLIPKESYNLTFEDGTLGGRFLAVKGGFVDLEPLWPGRTSVMYSYGMDCGSRGCDLGREITHPIADVNVLIADTGVEVKSRNLVFEGNRQAEGRSFLNYTGKNLKPGDQLDLNILVGRSTSAQTTRPTSGNAPGAALPWIILGGVLAGLVLIYPFWRQRVRAAAIEEMRQAKQSSKTERGPR